MLNVAIRLRSTTCWNVSSERRSVAADRAHRHAAAGGVHHRVAAAERRDGVGQRALGALEVGHVALEVRPAQRARHAGAVARRTVEHRDLPAAGDDALGGGLRHPRRAPDRDQTQSLQFHARSSVCVRSGDAYCVSTRRYDSASRPSGSPPSGRVGRVPAPDALVEPVGVGDLADVAPQRLELALERVGDVDERRRCRRPSARYISADRPRLEALVEQLGVGERVPGVGVHRGHGRLAGGEVVGMAGVDALEVALGRLADDPLRSHPADHAADVAPQVEVDARGDRRDSGGT